MTGRGRGLLTGLLVVLLLAGTTCGRRPATGLPPTSFKDLAAQCAASLDATGFGTVSIQTLAVHNETRELAVPCVVHLRSGARLQLTDSHVRTRNLIISDDGPGSDGVEIRIEHSSLAGVGKAGLFIHLRHAQDSIAIHHSSLDYGLSIWITVGGRGPAPDEGGGRIEATHSTFHSLDPAGDGISLVAGEPNGVGRFEDDTFRSAARDGMALLFAADCREEKVTGAVPICAIPPSR